MNPIRMLVAAPILLAAFAQFATAAEPTAPESARSFLLRMQEDAAAPIIKHCADNVPELKTFLEAEYASFKSRFRAASAVVLEESVASEELEKPIPPEVAAELLRAQQQMLIRVKSLDAKTYCTQLRSNLANETVASLKLALASALAQYASQGEAKSP